MGSYYSIKGIAAGMIRSNKKSGLKEWVAVADASSWLCASVILCLLLLSSVREDNSLIGGGGGGGGGGLPLEDSSVVKGNYRMNNNRPCDEIYIVGEGETLHTISDKCGDPYIVEQNPHIHDPDDVFPGLVIKITPTYAHH